MRSIKHMTQKARTMTLTLIGQHVNIVSHTPMSTSLVANVLLALLAMLSACSFQEETLVQFNSTLSAKIR